MPQLPTNKTTDLLVVSATSVAAQTTISMLAPIVTKTRTRTKTATKTRTATRTKVLEVAPTTSMLIRPATTTRWLMVRFSLITTMHPYYLIWVLISHLYHKSLNPYLTYPKLT